MKIKNKNTLEHLLKKDKSDKIILIEKPVPEIIRIEDHAIEKAYIICDILKALHKRFIEWYGFLVSPKEDPTYICDVLLEKNKNNDTGYTNISPNMIAKAANKLEGKVITGWIHSHPQDQKKQKLGFSQTDYNNMVTVLNSVSLNSRTHYANQEINTQNLGLIVNDEQKQNGNILVKLNSQNENSEISDLKILEPVFVGWSYNILIDFGRNHYQEIMQLEERTITKKNRMLKKKLGLEIIKTDYTFDEKALKELIKEVKKNIKPKFFTTWNVWSQPKTVTTNQGNKQYTTYQNPQQTSHHKTYHLKITPHRAHKFLGNIVDRAPNVKENLVERFYNVLEKQLGCEVSPRKKFIKKLIEYANKESPDLADLIDDISFTYSVYKIEDGLRGYIKRAEISEKIHGNKKEENKQEEKQDQQETQTKQDKKATKTKKKAKSKKKGKTKSKSKKTKTQKQEEYTLHDLLPYKNAGNSRTEDIDTIMEAVTGKVIEQEPINPNPTTTDAGDGNVYFQNEKLAREDYEVLNEISQNYFNKTPEEYFSLGFHSVNHQTYIAIERNYVACIMLCQVGLTEIPEQLSKFHNLKRLHIGYNKIENIEYSETLQSLEVLGIKGNPLNEKSKSIVDKLEASGVRMI